jgi:hypothetical protein
VKTTIDIPEPLYKRAKIRAIERGQTLKQLVLDCLGRELNTPEADADPTPKTFAEKRRLLPEFARFEREGAFTPRSGDRDTTELISEDRDAR